MAQRSCLHPLRLSTIAGAMSIVGCFTIPSSICELKLQEKKPMDFNFSPEDEAFRKELRAWLEVNAPKNEAPPADSIFEAGPSEWRRAVAWYKNLAAGGWTCINWPKEYGGRGAGILQTILYNQELARGGAPVPTLGFGPGLLGPTLMHWGSEEQKQRYIPKIISGDEIWCQGYSEPGSGS